MGCMVGHFSLTIAAPYGAAGWGDAEADTVLWVQIL